MKRIFLNLLLFIGVYSLYGQEKNCDCLDEINEVAQLIKNAKSYKIQIKRKGREAEFKKRKEKINQKIIDDSLSNFFCSGYLQKYVSFINDKHNQIYIIPDNISSNVPNYSSTIDTIIESADKVSGIYYAGSDKIMIQKVNDSTWYGITLKSDLEEWPRRKLRLRINKTPNGNFELFEFFSNGLLFYQKNIEISDGRIHSTFWNKENKYFFNKNHKDNFTYKSINPFFDYIGIKTLSRSKALMKEADDFYDQYLNRLNKENLIIDLRNNGGGSINQAKPLLKALRKNNHIKHIYVLINFKTASAAELTTLKLKEDKRTIILGENSRGMVAYGYGNKAFSTTTECAGFKLVLSTNHRNKRLGKYEYVGIKPDIELNNKSDWVQQIIELTEK